MFYKAKYRLDKLNSSRSSGFLGFYYFEFNAVNDLQAIKLSREYESKVPEELRIPKITAILESIFEIREVELDLLK